MITTTISQLKNSLSAYLKRVRAGETVMILDRQEPIAMLERIRPDRQPDARLKRLEQAGVVRPPQHPDARTVLDGIQLPSADTSVLQALIEERRAGR